MNKKLFSLASILMLLRMHVDMGSIPLPDIQYAASNILIQDITLPGAQPSSTLLTSTQGSFCNQSSWIWCFTFALWKKTSRPPLWSIATLGLTGVWLQSGLCLGSSPLWARSSSCCVVLNLFSGVMIRMFPSQVKIMAILRPWIRINSTNGSDTDRSDGESEEDEFVHRSDNE